MSSKIISFADAEPADVCVPDEDDADAEQKALRSASAAVAAVVLGDEASMLSASGMTGKMLKSVALAIDAWAEAQPTTIPLPYDGWIGSMAGSDALVSAVVERLRRYKIACRPVAAGGALAMAEAPDSTFAMPEPAITNPAERLALAHLLAIAAAILSTTAKDASSATSAKTQ